MSNVWEYILLKSENRKTLTKKAQTFFGFILKVSTFQTLYLKSKIETSDRLFQYSHYCLESFRLSALPGDVIYVRAKFLKVILFAGKKLP